VLILARECDGSTASGHRTRRGLDHTKPLPIELDLAGRAEGTHVRHVAQSQHPPKMAPALAPPKNERRRALDRPGLNSARYNSR
jgi:hypothetical protein